MRRRTKVLLIVPALAVAAVVAFLPRAAPEPRGSAMSVVDTDAEKAQLRQMLREGRATLVKPDEIHGTLTPEQRELLARLTGVPTNARDAKADPPAR